MSFAQQFTVGRILVERRWEQVMVDLSARLEAAALLLAGPGHIKERLLEAYRTQLEDIQDSDFPGAEGAEFAEMIRVLHQARALPGDDVVKASVRKLSNDEACRYAALVVRLYGMAAGLKHVVGSARTPRPAAPLAKFLLIEANANS